MHDEETLQRYFPNWGKPKPEPRLEVDLQMRACKYLTKNWPGVIFTSSLTGERLGASDTDFSPQRNRQKILHSSRGIPDLLILEPRGPYHGLMIELKTLKNPPFRKDGQLRKVERLPEQWAVIQALIKKGYRAGFCCGWEQTKIMIDDYLNN